MTWRSFFRVPEPVTQADRNKHLAPVEKFVWGGDIELQNDIVRRRRGDRWLYFGFQNSDWKRA